MKKLVALLVICLVSVVANAALVGDLTMVGNVVSLNITGSPADPFFCYCC